MVESTKLESKDLLRYLQELPPSIVASLYQHPAACLAVFRSAQISFNITLIVFVNLESYLT